MPLETPEGDGGSGGGDSNSLDDDEVMAVLDGIQSRLDEIESRLQEVEKKSGELDARVDGLEQNDRAFGAGILRIVDETATREESNKWRAWLENRLSVSVDR